MLLSWGRQHTILPNFPKKLHEIERIWTPQGVMHPGRPPPLDPPLGYNNMKFSNVALSFCKENLKYSVNLHILIFITNENMYKQRRYDRILKLKWRSRLVYHSNNANLCHGILNVTSLDQVPFIINQVLCCGLIKP